MTQVQVWQYRRGDAGDEKPRGDDVAPQASADGQRQGRMRQDSGHAAALDEALPDDPVVRYAEADSRFHGRLTAAQTRGIDRSIAYPNLYGTMFTPETVVDDLLSCESEVLEQTM